LEARLTSSDTTEPSERRSVAAGSRAGDDVLVDVDGRPLVMRLEAPTWSMVLTALVAMEAVLVAAHLVVGLPLGIDRLRIDQELSLPTWFSSTQFAVAALVCLRVGRPAWTAAAVLLLAFSIDEATGGHEQVGAQVGYSLAEEALQPALAALVAAGLVWLARRAGGVSGRLVLAGAAALLGGQAMATLSSRAAGGGIVGDGLGVAEEWLEMFVGSFLLCAGLAAAAPTDRTPGTGAGGREESGGRSSRLQP
jgi:hypothetical protein